MKNRTASILAGTLATLIALPAAAQVTHGGKHAGDHDGAARTGGTDATKTAPAETRHPSAHVAGGKSPHTTAPHPDDHKADAHADHAAHGAPKP